MMKGAFGSRVVRGALLLVCGLAFGALINVPWLAQYLEVSGMTEDTLPEILTDARLLMVVNAVAGGLIIWGLFLLFLGRSPKQRLVSTLIGRGDYVGAAQIEVSEGNIKNALALFRKGRAWGDAAKIALELGRDTEAAELLRRAGSHNLAEAGRLYRRAGDIANAQRCDRDLADWLTSLGRWEEAVEAWMRAGEPKRAAGAAKIAVEEGRFSSSHPALPVARRAAEQMDDQHTLARLHEISGNWHEAAHAWRAAGDNAHAADIFRKAGHMHDAAMAESAAGHPREAAHIRLQQLKKLHDRLSLAEAQGPPGQAQAAALREQVEREEESLIPVLAELGMRREMIDVIVASGRAEEAVARLVAQNEDAEAVDLAISAQLWHLAAPMLERLHRWGEASDIYELAGSIESAARCAELAGEYERALQLYRSLGIAGGAAHCMARLGFLQDALVELHKSGLYGEALEVLQQHPGPVPDIPDVILDMADWAKQNLTREIAIACLQRAVIGVALQPGRLEPPVALARELAEVGERPAALAQLERVLSFDYSHEGARSLRSEIGTAAGASQPAPASAGAGDAEAQQRYEILTKLGRGGMGVVYKARDTRLERDVAIKVLRTTSPEEAYRLGQEARAAATLNHPGIVTIHDFEEGFDGYFIAMEYVPGESLDTLLKRNPDGVRANLVPLLIRVAEAVGYAHSHQVIHRDLKPGNILVTTDGGVKILDFGIADRLDRSDGERPSISGTPFYMAPEQIRQESQTPATDIYAFGATAFHLATGRPPFHTGNVIDAHLDQTPPDPLDLAPELHPELARIILRCLEKAPEDRYHTIDELRAELDHLME
jgi:tRNA A-37 threonylcarbamoyl transferase component Bud32